MTNKSFRAASHDARNPQNTGPLMNATLLHRVAALTVLTASVHPLVGERRILSPILDATERGPRILKSRPVRAIVRFA